MYLDKTGDIYSLLTVKRFMAVKQEYDFRTRVTVLDISEAVNIETDLLQI